MSDDLRNGIELAIRAEAGGADVLQDYVSTDAAYMTVPRSPAVRHEWSLRVVQLAPPGGEPALPPLSVEKQFALTVLLGRDDATIANALADYLLDRGHEYATAVAEKARKEEQEAIAERLYSESAHLLGLSPEPNDVHEFAATALSSVADDLMFDRPPTAQKMTE